MFGTKFCLIASRELCTSSVEYCYFPFTELYKPGIIAISVDMQMWKGKFPWGPPTYG